MKWQGKELEQIELHPIGLGIGPPIGQIGRPVLAEGEVTDEILDRFQLCSNRF